VGQLLSQAGVLDSAGGGVFQHKVTHQDAAHDGQQEKKRGHG
jgi:hypothetical protein